MLFIMLLLTTACQNTNVPTETNIQGEEQMEEKLLTKEEFIQLIKENDVDVTVQSFDGVDMDEFIAYYYISKEVFDEFISGGFNLRRNLEGYIENAPLREEKKRMDPYLVRELKYIESTDNEYKEFIDKYFEALQVNAEKYKEENGVEIYELNIEGNGTTYFRFCRTSKSKKLELSKGEKDDEENYMIIQYSGDMNYYLDIYYSKSGKYLMYFDGNAGYSFEERLNIIRTFCELED